MTKQPPNGLIAVDKMGGKVIFIDPATDATREVLDDFAPVPHELLVLPQMGIACVPIYGDGIHGRNPHPGHLLSIVDLAARRHVADIDLAPLLAPHGLQLGPDGLLYVTCEDSAVVAIIDLAARKLVGTIDTGSRNAHRLAIAPTGDRLYTENEEDASISVIDLAARTLLRQIPTPHALAGLAIPPDGQILVAVDDQEPMLLLIDAETGALVKTVPLEGVPEPAQIARYRADGRLLLVTSLRSGTATLIDTAFSQQTTLKVGSQPMDAAFLGDSLYVACQGDGTIHVIDLPSARVTRHFHAGTGCEALGFF